MHIINIHYTGFNGHNVIALHFVHVNNANAVVDYIMCNLYGCNNRGHKNRCRNYFVFSLEQLKEP